MNDLQKCQLEILKQFIRVCEKYNLRYFLVGGTALGAIRHKGFIPWDDDIDVGMPRKDYDIYITLQKEYEGTPYFIQNYHTDKNFVYNYSKLRNSETTYVEDNFVHQQFNHGVWIDIFPYDGTPVKTKDNPVKFKNKVYWTWFNFFLCYPFSLLRKFSKRTFFKDLGLNIIALLFFWCNIGHYRNKHIDKVIHKYDFDQSEYVAVWFGTNPKKEAMKREIFDGVKKVPFEDIEANVPYDYDAYLTALYHDYMTPPPLDKQVGHHHHKGCDLNVDYKTYRKEHRQ